MHVFSAAREDGVECFVRRLATWACRAWVRQRRRAPRRSYAADARRRFLRGLPAGRVAEMLGNERLGQQRQQKMAEDVRPRTSGLLPRRSREAHSAFKMLECDFDAPSQSIEVADRRQRIFLLVERCDD